MKAILIALFLTACQAAFSQETGARYASHAEKKEAPKKALLLYPNPSTNGAVTITTAGNRELHFYIFDIEGTMVYQAILKKKERKTIQHLQKGTYMYTVFANDESIEEGKLIIK